MDLEDAVADDAAQVALHQLAGDETGVVLGDRYRLEDLEDQLLQVGGGDADAVGRWHVHDGLSRRRRVRPSRTACQISSNSFEPSSSTGTHSDPASLTGMARSG